MIVCFLHGDLCRMVGAWMLDNNLYVLSSLFFTKQASCAIRWIFLAFTLLFLHTNVYIEWLFGLKDPYHVCHWQFFLPHGWVFWRCYSKHRMGATNRSVCQHTLKLFKCLKARIQDLLQSTPESKKIPIKKPAFHSELVGFWMMCLWNCEDQKC